MRGAWAGRAARCDAWHRCGEECAVWCASAGKAVRLYAVAVFAKRRIGMMVAAVVWCALGTTKLESLRGLSDRVLDNLPVDALKLSVPAFP